MSEPALQPNVREIFEHSGWFSSIRVPTHVDDILNELVDLAKTNGYFLCRGEPCSYKTGKPSISRDEDLGDEVFQVAEPHLIAQFRSRMGHNMSPNEIELTRTIWGTLVLMQHYHAPTRLLDWTMSPLVAAFFASVSDLEADGYVFAFRIEHLNPQDDEVIARDGMLKIRSLNEWSKRLQKWEARPKPDGVVLALRPMRTTARVVAQQAYFTLGIPATLDHRKWLGQRLQAPDSKRVIVIPKNCKQELLRVLAKFNVTSASLYPDMIGAGQSVGDILRAKLPTPPAPVEDWGD